jgi:hypothetical protein
VGVTYICYKCDTKQRSSNFKPFENIHTESSYITNKAMRRCDAAASAQNTQRCRDVLRIPEYTVRKKDEKISREQAVIGSLLQK